MSNISPIRVGSTVPYTAVPTNMAKIKEKIISELFEKVPYNNALSFAKSNISIIKQHQSCMFTSSMPHSLQYTIMHLANLKFRFEPYDNDKLNLIFQELFDRDPNNKESKQLESIISTGDIKNSNYTKYKYYYREFTLPNRSTFIGILINKESYYGKLNYTNGNTFMGQLKNWYPDNGKLIYANGDTFKGLFEYGEPYYGELFTTNKEIFRGRFSNNKLCNGKLTYANGDFFKGEFKNGEPYKGELFTTNNGFFKKQFIIKDREVDIFKEQIKSDFELFFYPNGDTFKGLFRYDKLWHGQLTYANGDFFYGGFKDDKPYKGELFTANNGIFKKQSLNGKLYDMQVSEIKK